jgi:signal transduction histidine kinase
MRDTGSMRMANLLRSGAFRFAILICAIFAIGTGALLFKVERSVSGYAMEVASDSVATEVATLRDEDKVAGRPQMLRSIMYRERAVREHQLRYLLVDAQGHRLAGTIPPEAARVGWHDLILPPLDRGDEDGAATVSLMALGERLADGSILIVGSDTSDLTDLRHSLQRSTIAFGLGISLLALLGGLVVGTVFLRRLDRVNQVIGRIIHGSMAERLPAIGMGPEFDDLSTNLNLMLDRIEGLMTGMRQVSTDIAHDLRTPLTRLRQRLETIREGFDRQKDGADAQIDAAIAQTDSILAIFHALLRISSLEAGAGRQRLSKVDLSEIVERVYQAFLPVAEDARHILSAAIEPGVRFRGDAELLAQAITNLIENALVHTPPGCHITLSLRRATGGVSMSVADDGPGIPAEDRDKVLQRFYRLDRSRNSPGAGLGLALVSAIASLHEAKLSLTDNGPGLRVEMIFNDPENS